MVAMNCDVPVSFPAVVRTKFVADIDLQVALRKGMLESPIPTEGILSELKNPNGK